MQAGEVEGSNDDFDHGGEVSDEVGTSIGSEEVGGNFRIGRVVACGSPELEKVEQRQCCDELCEAPDAVAGESELDGSDGAG